jgi:pilus assembly protein Flp/PilA
MLCGKIVQDIGVVIEACNLKNFTKGGRAMEAIKKFMKGEEGVTAIEYGLIAAGIAVAVVAVVFILGTKINAAFQSVADCLK